MLGQYPNLVICRGFREHLETYHADDLKNPPVHHNGKRRKGDPGYIPIVSDETRADSGLRPEEVTA